MMSRPPACRRALLSLPLIALTAFGATAGAALDKSIRETTDPGQHASEIAAFIKQNVQSLQSDSPKAAAAAREELVSQVVKSGAVAPTVEFQDFYSGQLNQPLAGLMKSRDVRVRLLSAIVAAGVAGESHSARLDDIITAALEDESTAVRLWGIKGAGAILPQVMSNPLLSRNQRLTAGVLAAVKKDSNFPPLVQDAYAAADMGVKGNPNLRGPNATDIIDAASKATLDLMDVRLKTYLDGAPHEPAMEADPMLTLISGYSQQSKEIKQRTAQALVDLFSLLAQVAAKGEVEDRGRLNQTIGRVADGIRFIVSSDGGDPAVEAKLGAFRRIRISEPGDQVSADVQALVPQILALPAYADLKKPPVLNAAKPKPTTAPASAPAATSAPAPASVPVP